MLGCLHINALSTIAAVCIGNSPKAAILSSPKFKQVVVATNGTMAEMVTVDPRAFAFYKVYLAQKDDRDPMKVPRDIAQARAVYRLMQEKMPHLSFDRIHALPEKLRNKEVYDILDPNSK